MSESIYLWIFSILTTAILGLLVTLWTFQQKRLRKIEDRQDKADLAAFKAMDAARESGWTIWREDRVERSLDNHEERLRSHTSSIARIEGRLNGIHK